MILYYTGHNFFFFGKIKENLYHRCKNMYYIFTLQYINCHVLKINLIKEGKTQFLRKGIKDAAFNSYGIKKDPLLSNISGLIIDEAHERV